MSFSMVPGVSLEQMLRVMGPKPPASKPVAQPAAPNPKRKAEPAEGA